jgi:hypothetical protein
LHKKFEEGQILRGEDSQFVGEILKKGCANLPENTRRGFKTFLGKRCGLAASLIGPRLKISNWAYGFNE